MTQTKENAAAQGNGADDPLGHLHRMSTTAGLGSQEYVEINVTAVVAALFGVASLLAIASPVLLVFPVVGVILSAVAIRQVNHSNGTQTGRWLAILGLVLSGLITAAILSYQALQGVRQRDDHQALTALCDKYGELLVQGKFAEAYDLFDPGFQARVGKPAFISQLSAIQHQVLVPPISSVAWNGLASFQTEDDGTVEAEGMIIVRFKGQSENEEARLPVRFKKGADGVWLINNIPDQFPAPRTAAQQ
jgi:hypothetical protein